MATSTKKTSSQTNDAGRAANTERVIKKYPNRRLYDTLTSTYIALSDVKQLVMNGLSFKVVDAKTNEDLTRSLLLQIILEEEAGGTPLFSETVLANIIRTYGHTMQGFMGHYLEKNLQVFADMQKQFTAQSTPTQTAPTNFPADIWTRQMNALQDQMMAAFGMKKQ